MPPSINTLQLDRLIYLTLAKAISLSSCGTSSAVLP
jgi:hypothetical protein